MCIVLTKPAGKRLPFEIYRNCFEHNDDGAGFAFAEEGKLVVSKGHMSLEKFFQAYEPHELQACVVHFRIGTAGPNNEANCHPWVVENCHQGFSFAVAHNGCLTYPHRPDKSDTGCFVDEILGPILKRDPWFLDHPAGIYLLEETVGLGNKFVILRNDGRTYYLHKKQGVEDDGVWYSNSGYKRRPWGSLHGLYEDDDIEPSYLRLLRNERPSMSDVPTQTTIPSVTRVETKPVRVSAQQKSLLPHLSRRERKAYFRHAIDMFGSEGIYGSELISRVRDAFIDCFPDKASLPDSELDKEILKVGLHPATFCK